jgi:hypothetical protein
MAKKDPAESSKSEFRKNFHLKGEAPNAKDTGATGPASTRQAYKRGGKVKGKVSTPQRY